MRSREEPKRHQRHQLPFPQLCLHLVFFNFHIKKKKIHVIWGDCPRDDLQEMQMCSYNPCLELKTTNHYSLSEQTSSNSALPHLQGPGWAAASHVLGVLSKYQTLHTQAANAETPSHQARVKHFLMRGPRHPRLVPDPWGYLCFVLRSSSLHHLWDPSGVTSWTSPSTDPLGYPPTGQHIKGWGRFCCLFPT